MSMKYLIVICYLILNINGKLIEKKCPSICKCDMRNNLRRAICSEKNLVMMQSDIPEQAEILDLSQNKISQLEANIFSDVGLKSLKALNISHNRISQIHLNAFEGLDILEILDLSYNSIQYVLPIWFSTLNNLEELYLRGNNLGPSFQTVIESTKLKVLDLSYCRITDISPRTYNKLHNLRKLDLSGNFLFKLDFKSIQSLKLLKFFDVRNNTLDCNDSVVQNLNNYSKMRGILYQDSCSKTEKIKNTGFERMIKLPAETTTVETTWIFNDTNDGSYCTICPNATNNSILYRLIELSPVSFILLPFVAGILIGLNIFVCIPHVLQGCKCKKQMSPKRISTRRIVKRRGQEGAPLFYDLENMGQSTPIVQRKL